MKKIAILGSTGSIGTQTIDVIRMHGDDFMITALSAGSNVDLLAEQIREFHPALVSAATAEDASKLSEILGSGSLPGGEDALPEITYGMDGLLSVASESDSDILVTAIVGMMGIRPTIAAIEAGKDIALANKETLVTAGHIIMPLAKAHGVRILPVDSEHSAIFQCSDSERARGNAIDKIYLTASGGTFRGMTRDELRNVTVEDALRNPNWNMGKKVTVDSATLVNKGLETMEAKWLFGVGPDQIEVVIHPQSIIHSMVQYEDGAVLAQLGVPDMRLPILYALCYPERKDAGEERLDFFKLGSLTFERPDTDTFPGLTLAAEALHRGGNIPTVFNAANERAVALFLDGKIPFLAITDLIADAMDHCVFVEDPDVGAILATERSVYERIESIWPELT